MPITGKHLIAGQWQQGASPSFASVDPRTTIIGATLFADATDAEVSLATEQAFEAFQASRCYSSEKLANFLNVVADEIELLGEELLSVCDSETGLGLHRLTGERGRTTNQLRAFANHILDGTYVEAIIDTAQPERQPFPRPDIRRMLIPLGPVAVFTPNNFPLAFGVAGGDTASAFASGCPVIVKAHPSHPATSELVARAIANALEKCDLHPGFFSMLQGQSIDVGQALVKAPQITAIGFTGSLRGGRAIFDTASARPIPIPVYAEMGSINPVVVLPEAVKERHQSLVAGITGSVTLGSGQFCTNPGLFLLEDGAESRRLVQDVAKSMQAQTPTVLLNEAVEQELANRLQPLSDSETVTIVTGGTVENGDGFCFANTVLQTTGAAFLEDKTLQEEHFGPVTLFVLCDNLAQIETVIDTLDGNLTATIHGTDAELATSQRLFDLLQQKVGRLILNGYPTGVEVVHAMVHGGPYPATTIANSTSVGMTAIQRFMRPIAYQNLPDALLPDALKDANPLNIWRIVDNVMTKQAIE